jgi:hypothetical protein
LGDDSNVSNALISDMLKQDESSSTATLSSGYSGKESVSPPVQGDKMDID